MATSHANDKGADEIYVNVEGDAPFHDRLVRESRAWTAPKLVVLTVVTLGIAFVALYGATIWTGTWGRTIDYPSFLMPESPESAPSAQPPAYR